MFSIKKLERTILTKARIFTPIKVRVLTIIQPNGVKNVTCRQDM